MPLHPPHHPHPQHRSPTALIDRQLFEKAPVPVAVATLSLPTILSQLVTMIYNMADTYFIGQLNNPYMLAALALCFPIFYSLNFIGNLFGLGGASVISRLLGAKHEKKVKFVSSFSFYATLASGALYALLSYSYSQPILRFLGASPQTIEYASQYFFYVVTLGAIPTVISLSLANLLRSDGHAAQASWGLMAGGILNIILDPIFIFYLQLEVRGAALATLLSNFLSAAYFILLLVRWRQGERTALSLNPRHFTLRCLWEVVSIGASSALNTILAGVGNFLIVRLSAQYGDIPIAAFGIVKRVDMLPINISMGICQGYMPLVGYNFAARNYKRMRAISHFAWLCGLLLSLFCVALSWLFSEAIVGLFIEEPQTLRLGAQFLRIASLGVPMTVVNFLICYGLQAMGYASPSLALSAIRLGLFNISCTLLLDHWCGMYGVISAQPIAEAFSLVISLGVYLHLMRQLHAPPRAPLSRRPPVAREVS